MTPEEIKVVTKEAGAQLMWKPSVPIYLSGPKPFGGTWCATCSVLWMGHLSNDPAMQKYVRKAHDASHSEGQDYAFVDLEGLEHDPKMPVLQLAITVAPSIYSEVPMPVCWTHIKPYRFPTPEETAKMKEQGGTRNPLIAGKANWTPGGMTA